MQFSTLTDRLSTQFDDLRDRTAGAVGGRGGSVFRELGKLSKQVSSSEKRLHEHLDEIEDRQGDALDDLFSAGDRTTWPRRLFWVMFGAAAGAIGAYLADPDRGDVRRQQLNEQVMSRANEVRDQVVGQAEQVRNDVTTQAKQAVDRATEKANELREQATGQAQQAVDEAASTVSEVGKQATAQADETLERAQGAVAETAKQSLPDTPTDDQHVLEDRIKSEVFGHRDDVQDVVIKVDAPGRVALKGTVPSPRNERELLAAVADVEGVTDVRSELTVRSV